MLISNKLLIVDFCQKHERAIKPFIKWLNEIEAAEWEKHADLKQTFPHADYVGNGRYVFNISGNNFRLVALVIFLGGVLDVRYVGTHADYSKQKNISEF
ncbi:type II toxin-antitoxin system HigB family toxin [Bacteroides sp. OttesenSCG-928-J23]|nr:type II toxin-antitoxin system HigB family toxin [Bacteroides sp. OttesenSCG-928-J23]